MFTFVGGLCADSARVEAVKTSRDVLQAESHARVMSKISLYAVPRLVQVPADVACIDAAIQQELWERKRGASTELRSARVACRALAGPVQISGHAME